MGRGRQLDIAWPDLFSVYATPLLQHQAQNGLNPAVQTTSIRRKKKLLKLLQRREGVVYRR